MGYASLIHEYRSKKLAPELAPDGVARIGRQTVEQSVGKLESIRVVDRRVGEIGTAKCATDPLFQTADAEKFVNETASARNDVLKLAPAGPCLFPNVVVDHVKFVDRYRIDAAIAAQRQ
jgi:hypothetical protein